MTIPNSVSNIGISVFADCKGLTSFIVDSDNNHYSVVDNVLFNKEKTELISCAASKTGTYNIPNSVTTIGEDAFAYCSNLTSITIPNSVTCINANAFWGCRDLTSIILPNSVTSIEYGAFGNCTKLMEMTCEATDVPVVTDEIFSEECAAKYGTLHVPSESLEKYRNAEGWRVWREIKPISNSNSSGSQPLKSLQFIPEAVYWGTNSTIITYFECQKYTIPKADAKIVDTLEGTTVHEDYWNTYNNESSKVLNCTAQYYLNPSNANLDGAEFSLTTGDVEYTRAVSHANAELSIIGTPTVSDGILSVKLNCKHPELIKSVPINEAITLFATRVHLPNAANGESTITSDFSSLVKNSMSNPVLAFSKKLGYYNDNYDNFDNYDYHYCDYYTRNGGEVLYTSSHLYPTEQKLIEECGYDGIVTCDYNKTLDLRSIVEIHYNDEYGTHMQMADSECEKYGFKVKYELVGNYRPDNPISESIFAAINPKDGYTFRPQIANGSNPYGYGAIQDRETVGHCPVIRVSLIDSETGDVYDYGYLSVKIVDTDTPPSEEDVDVEPDQDTNPDPDTNNNPSTDTNPDTPEVVEPEPDTDISQYDNIIYIEPSEAKLGESATLSLKMNNNISVAGFQCDIDLPNGVTVATDTYGNPLVALSTDRTTSANTNFFDGAMQTDGSLRIMAGTSKGIAIEDNEGEVATFVINVEEGIDVGEYPIIIKNIVISDLNSNTYEVDRVKATLTIDDYTIGDPNDDGKINIGDFTAIANYIMGNPPAKFSLKAADVNGDTKINVGDLTGVANLILYGSVTSTASNAKRRKVASDVSGMSNTIYVDESSAIAGSTCILSVKMKNDVDISGYQFDMYLPEGITVAKNTNNMYMASLSTQRTDATKTNFFDYSVQSDGAFRVLCSSTKSNPATQQLFCFSGNDGEVATITLQIAEDMEPGEYPIIFKAIVLSDPTNNTYETDYLEVTITIEGQENIEYAEGYSISIAPFVFDTDVETSFTLDNASEITNIAFDVKVPSEWIDGELYYIDNVFAKTKFTTSDDLTDHTINVTIDKKSSNKIAVGSGTEIATLGLAYDAGIVEEGIYPIIIDNIHLTDVDGTEYNVAPITSYVKVGKPLNESLKLIGKVPADVNNALNTESAITSLDMSDVIGVDGTLTLVDKRAVKMPTDNFVLSEINYTRKMSSNWATLCLPFAVSSNDNVQLYQLKSTSDDMMVFKEIDNLEAGMPGVFLKLNHSAEDVTFSANDVSINIPEKETEIVNGFQLIGTYDNIKVDVNETPACYIKNDTFMNGVGYFYIDSFRGYYLNNTPSSAKSFRIAIEDETTGNITIIGNIDTLSGKIYSIDGVQVKSAKGMYIENGKKFFRK